MSDDSTTEIKAPEPDDNETPSSIQPQVANATTSSEIRMRRTPAALLAVGLVALGVIGGAVIAHGSSHHDGNGRASFERAGFHSGSRGEGGGPGGGEYGRGGGRGMGGGQEGGMRGGGQGEGMRGGGQGEGMRGGGPGKEMGGGREDMQKLMCTVVKDELKLSNSDISTAVKNAASTLQKDGTLSKEQADRIKDRAADTSKGFLKDC